MPVPMETGPSKDPIIGELYGAIVEHDLYLVREGDELETTQ